MKKFLVVLLLSVSAISMSQEKVLLRLNYKKGDMYSTKMNMHQLMGAGLMEMNMSMVMNQKIVNVLDANTKYESEMKIASIKMDMMQSGIQMAYDSSKKDEELDQGAQMMKNQMEPMLKAVIKTKGNNLGEIFETKVEPNLATASEFANQSSNVVYPKNSVKVGDTWTMNKSSKGMNLNFVYKVNTIEAKKVTLGVTGKVIGMATGDIKGSMEVDKKSGIPLVSKINMTMKVQGQDLESKLTMTTTKM